MRPSLSQLKNTLTGILSENVVLVEAYRELTLEVPMAQLSATMQCLRDNPDLSFDALIDVAGVDYEEFTGRDPDALRFAVVYHLLSTRHNWRLRVRAFVENEEEPAAPSMAPLWPSADWMERECFDMFGIAFDGHPDLRRILTDYGFTGYPFRKDFPLSGHIEMRYDPEQKQVVYEPVTIEPRDNVPRIVREPHYGDSTPMPLPPSEPKV
ncbi:MAG: NADH-quinone oxidoreductase subunit C [Proteobacteria bacterium]|nr:NADH-quinone oxidoreductase subunit C [Pseudomonadota bacterium]MCL2307674.1 NADH-quinone oxidoreductase subunit C [Pseudomonadota bacterium]